MVMLWMPAFGEKMGRWSRIVVAIWTAGIFGAGITYTGSPLIAVVDFAMVLNLRL